MNYSAQQFPALLVRFLARKLKNWIALMRRDKEVAVFSIILLGIVFLAVFGDLIAPYDDNEVVFSDSGDRLYSQSPSLDHPLGTNSQGQDVFSRIVIGAQPTAIIGALGGTIIIFLGTLIGVTAGYKGGMTDNLLMRFTDFVYGVPLIPFAIVLLAIFDFQGLLVTVLVIGLILWRGSARVFRSQVLQIKERNYVMAARATGMSDTMIVVRHILPNIAPMMVLWFALGCGWGILVQAGLAFIGVSDAYVPTWGVIIRNAYSSGVMVDLWWWPLGAGIMISLTVISTFMLGRKYEEIASGGDEMAIAKGA